MLAVKLVVRDRQRLMARDRQPLVVSTVAGGEEYTEVGDEG
jgi:hypothetical protein